MRARNQSQPRIFLRLRLAIMTPLPPTPTAQALVRVLALPLSRRHTYYHIIQPPPPPSDSAAAPSLLRRALGRATALWDKMGSEHRAPGSWQRRAHAYGNRMMDRAVGPDERALKAVDPARPADAALLLHPSAGSELDHKALWAAHLAARMPQHRRAMLGWLAFSPVTAPFMIVPIIPNLPFFYCIWRAWSHYEAFAGARYLNALPLRAEPSPLLDGAYDGAAELNEDRMKRVVKAFDLPPHSAIEILRAIEHARAKPESES